MPSWVARTYCGSLCVIFAIIGALQRRLRTHRWVVAVAILGFITLVLSLGRHTPAYSVYSSIVPGAAYFRYPGFIVSLVSLLICAALIGLNFCRRKRKKL